MNVSNKVRRVMTAEGITDSELVQMHRHSVPCSSEFGNRRFHGWILDIRGDVCHNLVMVDMVHISQSRGHAHMEEEHLDCDGEGCKACNWIGRVIRHL